MSDLCHEYKIQPSVFYWWQNQLLGHLEAALEAGDGRRKKDSREARLERKFEALKARVTKKDGVIARISEELVASKMELGEPQPAGGFPTTRAVRWSTSLHGGQS